MLSTGLEGLRPGFHSAAEDGFGSRVASPEWQTERSEQKVLFEGTVSLLAQQPSA